VALNIVIAKPSVGTTDCQRQSRTAIFLRPQQRFQIKGRYGIWLNGQIVPSGQFFELEGRVEHSLSSYFSHALIVGTPPPIGNKFYLCPGAG
jgi:hypothetical protein